MSEEMQKGHLRVIAEEAAYWLCVLEEEEGVAEQERQEFLRWLRMSPRHVEEFLRAAEFQQRLKRLPRHLVPTVEALKARGHGNVVTLALPPANAEVPPPRRASPRLRWGWAAAMLMATAITFLLVAIDPFGREGVAHAYATARGEQRSILLPDGSMVKLNSKTKIRVRYSGRERLVTLLAGELLADVAKDPERPFRVAVGAARVEAIGTRFNVYRKASGTVVTVVEGIVGVQGGRTSALSEGAGLKVPAGAQVTVQHTGEVTAPVGVDTRRMTVWLERKLVFDGDALADVVTEVNRHNHPQIRIAEAALGNQRISGIFEANDPRTLTAFLQQVGGIRVAEDPAGQGWTLYAAAKGAASR